ncbi:MAG: nucleotidyltransferase domain-containing protein [Proteobacteria bacterium]|nr:nucleotidyltransferase domain-containing protein [Pseudomonadota bacterium]
MPLKDPRLQRIINNLIDKHHCHTLILYGSRARNEHTDVSDYDLIAIRDKGADERDCRTFEDAFLDVFIYSEASIKNPDETFLRVKDGIIICQKDDIGDKLLNRIREIIKKGPTPIPEWEKQVIITWHDKMFQRASKGDIEGNFRRVWQIYDLLESYFKLRNRWYFGPKEAFVWLKDNDIDTYELFDNVLKAPTDLNNIKKLIERVKITIK